MHVESEKAQVLFHYALHCLIVFAIVSLFLTYPTFIFITYQDNRLACGTHALALYFYSTVFFFFFFSFALSLFLLDLGNCTFVNGCSLSEGCSAGLALRCRW